MPLEKNQPLTLLFQSRKANGTANSTVAPTLTISKDGAAGGALAAPTLVEGMALTWAITLTAAQMNCTALAIEHTGAGLEAWGATIYPEAAYTAARGNNLVNLDAPVSSRLATSAYIAPDNAGLAGAVAATYGAAVAAKDSADQAARPGNAMALTSVARDGVINGLLNSVVDGGLTLLQVLRVKCAVLFGKAVRTENGVQFLRRDGVTVAVSVDFDAQGNRTSSTIGSV